MSLDPDKVQRLETDIDCRLAELWLTTWQPEGVLQDLNEAQTTAMAATVRAAYGKGYTDALREDREGRRGELQRTHGYRVD